MSPSAGDDASAPAPSRKALGKRKQVDGDEESATGTATPPPRRTKTRPPPGPKPNTWESQPTGPWCNPRSYGRPQTFKRIDEYYLAPRAWTLPYSKSFLDQLSKDVEQLLAAFEAAWHAHVAELEILKDVGSSDKKGKRRQQQQPPPLKSPLALFVDAWKQRGWHLVSLTWGEDERTRAAFFESTTRSFLAVSRSTTTQRSVGCLFALLLLYTCQTRWPDPVPGVKYEAFNWARPARQGQSDDGEWDPHARRGINAIQIEGDTHANLLGLVDKVKTDMRFPPATKAHIKRLCPAPEAALAIDGAFHDVSYALSELDRRSAWHILPSSKLLRGGRNPPFLPLYEEIDEEDKLQRQGDWGRLVEMKDEGDERVKARPGKTHSLSRSDVLLVRAAEALGVPLEMVFTSLGDGNGDVGQPGSSSSPATSPARRHLEYDDRRPDGKTETEHRMMTKWGNVWLEKPFRPMELPRTAKWLGGVGDDGHGAAASKLAELDEEIEVYMQLVGDLDEEAGVQGEAAASSSATR